MIDIFVYSLYRTLQVRKISGIFPENSGKFPTFYFSGKVTTLAAALYRMRRGKSRAVGAKEPRDAAATGFGLKFADNISLQV